MLERESTLLVVIRQQNAGLACLGRTRSRGVHREIKGIQVKLCRVLTRVVYSEIVFHEDGAE
jgi:hypothetical protein